MNRLALHWQILIAMICGAVLGVILNAAAGTDETAVNAQHPGGPIQVIGMGRMVDVPPMGYWVRDTPERILIQLVPVDGNADGSVRRVVIGDPQLLEKLGRQTEEWPEGDGAAVEVERTTYPTLDALRSKDPQAFALFELYGRSASRTIGDYAKALGNLFLRMLKMVSVPLIITSLLSGVTGLGQADRLGKMFGRTVLYYLTTSVIAIVIGLVVVNVVRPGARPIAEVQADAAANADAPAEGGQALPVVLFNQLQNMIPPNPFGSVARGEFLSIIAFSLAFGVCTILVGGVYAQRITELVEAAFHVMMKLTMLIIKLAPFGVFFLMLSVTASQGAGIFGTLGWYMLAVACALLIHAAVVLPLLLHYVARRNPFEYAKAMSPALLTAFSSASSNGTLPLTLTCVEQRAGMSNRVGSFVLPLGATINMDGTALYEVVAVLFIAQFRDIDLSLGQQVVVAFTALLASVGAAGIPHAGLVMMVIILQAVGLPTEDQGLIIAVDRVLDMGRTAVNVWSDSCGCAVISRFESGGPPLEPTPEPGSAGV
ncbi:MAG: dicarboxylate/amino acid:cation symporter [Planctomycetota bacterium]